MNAKGVGKRFEAGENITNVLDLARAQRTNQVQRRVNGAFPSWMIRCLDKEADRLGVTRPSIIKVWIPNVRTHPPWNLPRQIPFPLRLKELA